MMAAEGLDFVDLHEPIHEYLGDRKICDLLTQRAECVGHFNPEGNELVADIIYSKMKEKGFLQSN